MSTPAVQLKPEVELDRSNTLECVLDNLRRCDDLETQKSVLLHFMGDARRQVRRELRTDLEQYAISLEQQAEEQREESMKLVESAQHIRAMLELPAFTEKRNRS